MKHDIQNLKDKYYRTVWWLHYHQSEIVGAFVVFAGVVLLASLIIGC